jgi:hypothetical protein
MYGGDGRGERGGREVGERVAIEDDGSEGDFGDAANGVGQNAIALCSQLEGHSLIMSKG